MKCIEPARKKNKREPVLLIVVTVPLDELEIVGFYAVPNRMNQVLRLPGESLEMMERRALHSVTGGGQLVVFPITRRLEKHSNL